MDPMRLVVVSCAAPREKFWGVLLELSPAGVTVRGVPVEAFEDFLRQWAGDGEHLIGPVTLFFPLHRVERVEVDESAGVVEGLGERFARVAGRDPRTVLAEERDEPHSPAQWT
ncbi:MAG: hypothetical protein HRF46_11440 [Acidobacteriota bacterium]